MKTDYNTVAFIAYKIHTDGWDGKLIEFAGEQNPRKMIFGYDEFIEGFENRILGIEEGDEFEFKLMSGEAFGDYKPEMVTDVSKDTFRIDGVLREDLLYLNNEVSMIDNQGNTVKGKILEIGDKRVKMDFNHPLAGKQLFVSGKVMHVRPVVEEDIRPREGGCCGGSCGCGSNETKNEGHKHQHNHAEDEPCPVCGNPPELQGQGIGDCRCG
ncbi:MAG: peptidylprolyl isomerase [Chlorobi bacterium]|nr:peptidylprolyl isomerase [Chlorobiota bacterium]